MQTPKRRRIGGGGGGDESSAWDLSFGTEYTFGDEGELIESRKSAEFSMSNHYWSEILSLFEYKVV